MPTHRARRARRPRGRWIPGSAIALVCLIAVAVIAPRFAGRAQGGGAGAETSAPPHQALLLHSGAAELKAAIYNAVIPELLPYQGDAARMTTAYQIDGDTVLYGKDHRHPVAFIPHLDFLGNASVVVAVSVDGAWTKVLTPARVQLPSESHGNAPAQSAGWVKTSELRHPSTLSHRVEVSVSQQTLTVIAVDGKTAPMSYPVGVGQEGTPTPLGTGYLQARYLDPKQGETAYPIQLTSLHSAAADEPYGGSDGGLIGVHYNVVNSGAVSHGCIRLGTAAIASVNRLPLGTPVTISP